MCKDCGCEQANREHAHVPRSIEMPRRLKLEQSILAKNDSIAADNRRWFAKQGMRVLKLMSSPGSGKTLLLEKTMARLGRDLKTVVITGDQEGDFDAQRLKAAGAE